MHGIRVRPLGLHNGTDVEHTAPVQATVLLRLTAIIHIILFIIIIIMFYVVSVVLNFNSLLFVLLTDTGSFAQQFI